MLAAEVLVKPQHHLAAPALTYNLPPMRKELGTATRKLFFKRLREVAPFFERASKLDIPGCTWTFVRRMGRLRQWMWYQQHSGDDSFLVEISWSCRTNEPAGPPLGRPDTEFTDLGCRFRLGEFSRPGVDTWWLVGEGLPDLMETFARLLDGRPRERVDVAAHLPGIHAAVEEVIEELEEHALPYLARVAAWAASEEPEALPTPPAPAAPARSRRASRRAPRSG